MSTLVSFAFSYNKVDVTGQKAVETSDGPVTLVSDGHVEDIDPIIYIDVELGFDVNDNVRLLLDTANVFDSFVDTIGLPNANRLSVGLPYPRRTPANYEGGS